MAWRKLTGFGEIGRALAGAIIFAMVLAMPTTPAAAQLPNSGQAAAQAQQVGMAVSPEVARAVDQIYAGDPDAAIAAAAEIERENPNEPVGYLVEAEARWWKLYCTQSEIRYGMVDVWNLAKRPDEQPYLQAAQKAIDLAQAELTKKETAAAHLWAGMGYALEARLYGLRGERMATAKSGVAARTQLLRAIELDPQLADADTGLGLYNYYVATLSPIVKLLRFFLGIPGGSKREGIAQLRAAMKRGPLTGVEARFYLARNLRTYDQNYAEALEVAEPLVSRFSQNPVFLLLVGNLQLELGRRAEAEQTLGRIAQLKIPDPACATRSEMLARELLAQKP
jgi:hypothetical protein